MRFKVLFKHPTKPYFKVRFGTDIKLINSRELPAHVRLGDTGVLRVQGNRTHWVIDSIDLD